MSHSSTVLIPTIMSGLRDWSRLWRGWLTKPLLTAALFRTHQTKSIDSIHAFITVASTTFMSFSTLPVNLCCLLPLILVFFFSADHNTTFFSPRFLQKKWSTAKTSSYPTFSTISGSYFKWSFLLLSTSHSFTFRSACSLFKVQLSSHHSSFIVVHSSHYC